jgi:tight adherence protein B
VEGLTGMSGSIILWIAPLGIACCVGGLVYAMLRTLLSEAEQLSAAHTERTTRQLEDLFVFISPKRVAEAGWASSALAFLLAFFIAGGFQSTVRFAVGMGFGILAGLVGFQVPALIVRFLRTRRLRRFNLQLVDTLVSMSNALKAGFSITQAFESVVRDGENPIAQEFDVFLQQTRVGVSFTEALQNLDQRVGSEDLTLVIQAIEATRKTGGNLTEIFEKIAATIRERLRIENRIRTLTAQQRLQGIVVGAMPAIIGVALMIVDPSLMGPFIHSTAGTVVIGVVVLLVTLGGLWIRKIVRIDI